MLETTNQNSVPTAVPTTGTASSTPTNISTPEVKPLVAGLSTSAVKPASITSPSSKIATNLEANAKPTATVSPAAISPTSQPTPTPTPMPTPPANKPSSFYGDIPQVKAPEQAKKDKDDFLVAMDKSHQQSGTADASKENIDIYVMPKEFQKHNRVVGPETKTTGLIIIIVGFVALIGAFGAIYVYVINPESLKTWFGTKTETPIVQTQTPIETNIPLVTSTLDTAPTSTTPVAVNSLKDVYMVYVAGIQSATTYTDYYNLVNKYGSQNKLKKTEGEKLVVDASPEDGLKAINALKLATPALSGSETFTEDIPVGSSSAVLKIVLMDGTSSGQINLVLENGEWKIDNEAWSLTKAPDTTTTAYSAGEDRDSDQLTDLEETVLGSNKDVADTDGDSYQDGSEVMSLYDPLTPKNLLISNAAVRSHSSDNYKFTLLYPSQWIKSVDDQGDEGSVVFSNSDNDHMFQMLIMKNDNKEGIEAWYKNLKQVSEINPSQKISGDSWQGVMSTDGLIAYITDAKKERIYTFQYSPGKDKMLQYQHLFKASLKSLVIK